ncbi:MAG: Na/Pi cotransporter family protein [Magnetococcales bacterium]|nr:Na/Pi cotransporter family protein [Magnetococcales bacterium]
MKPLFARSSWMLGMTILALLLAVGVEAGESSSGNKELDFVTLAMGLMGGLAIFLYGMEKMGTSLKLVAGDQMKKILRTLTINRLMGMFTGAFVTAIIQSSSITTVLLVGFVSAELMTLTQAIGVIFGANIGTTITAQVIAFKVTKYALLMILVGFLTFSLGKQEKTRQYGHLVFGLGMVFFGMTLMSQAMHPLRSYPPFIELMQTVSNPLIGVMVGAGFTALVQSSSATTGVVLALAMQGLISLEAGIALTLGANIGTCVTAGLAAIGKPRVAVQVALAHTLFNVLGAMLVVGFIPQFADLVREISPTAAPELTGLARLAEEVPRQVANAHTMFNIVMAFFFLPFAGIIAVFCVKMLPERRAEDRYEEEASYRPKYLDDTMLSTPAFALSLVRREMNVLSDTVEEMLTRSLTSVLKPQDKGSDQMHQLADKVNLAYAYLTKHLSKMGSRNLPPHVADEVLASVTVIIEMKYISDIIILNLSHLADFTAKEGAKLPAEEIESLTKLQELTTWAFRSASTAFITDNQQAAKMVFELKETILGMDTALRSKKIRTMHAKDEDNLTSYTLYMELLDTFKRLFYHAKRIAKIQAKSSNAADWLSIPKRDAPLKALDASEQIETIKKGLSPS